MNTVELISQYLKGTRRLVIPGFGAFIVKENGEILFSELLTSDDGVLRGLLISSGLSELEAMGAIDRFVFEARYSLSQNKSFEMKGFGLLIEENSVVRFVQKQTEQPTQATAATSNPTAISEAKVTDVPSQRIAAPTSAINSSPRRKRRRRTDGIVIFAVLIILCALAAVLYGAYCSMLTQDDMEMERMRQPVEKNAGLY